MNDNLTDQQQAESLRNGSKIMACLLLHHSVSQFLVYLDQYYRNPI